MYQILKANFLPKAIMDEILSFTGKSHKHIKFWRDKVISIVAGDPLDTAEDKAEIFSNCTTALFVLDEPDMEDYANITDLHTECRWQMLFDLFLDGNMDLDRPIPRETNWDFISYQEKLFRKF